MRHIARDNQLLGLCSDTLLEPVQLVFRPADQVFAPTVLVVISLGQRESRDGMSQEQASIE